MSTATRQLTRSGVRIWSGVVYVWDHPVILVGVLLVLSALLFNTIIKDTFKPYTNCNYLLVNRLGMNAFFCDGYNVEWAGATIFTIPGLRGVMDPPLELVRTVTAWSVVIFFVFLSMFLTIIINRVTVIVKLLIFNKDEWKRFLGSLRTALAIFVVFCSIFYFTVIR